MIGAAICRNERIINDNNYFKNDKFSKQKKSDGKE